MTARALAAAPARGHALPADFGDPRGPGWRALVALLVAAQLLAALSALDHSALRPVRPAPRPPRPPAGGGRVPNRND